ncbi:MAG TPA: phosphatidate cytidylyltransferase [Candidatus Acidoferrales bacterium]|nr:phosphatidate cytidylyltransferase [Candidatus Acidoferrales bacterium]
MALRILTALALIPIVVGLVWFGPVGLLAVAAAGVAMLALVEFFELGERVGLHGFRKWTIACTAGLFYAQYSTGMMQTHEFSGGLAVIHSPSGATLSIEAVLLVFVFGCVCIGLATRRSLHDVLPGMSLSAGGLIFVALPFSYIVRISETERHGRELVLFTLVLIWAGDILAYFVGSTFGRIPMAPALSPKKTWEGALGNFFASLLVAVAFARWAQLDVVMLLVMAALANIAGQMGDLIESAYKRGAVVKDSGTLLPGHGGMLDRIDALVLACPVVWAVYLFLGRP